jgi:hypothetical protein
MTSSAAWLMAAATWTRQKGEIGCNSTLFIQKKRKVREARE